tara:strand:+ start:797 stop:985 length:189 start_codon:yes stop_codon:yes gene_type:complete
MTKIKSMVIWAEQFSLIALIIIFFKVLIFKPRCFDLFDSYFLILPLFITKILELSQLRIIEK